MGLVYSLLQQPLAVMGIAIGIGGILFGYLFYRRSRRIRLPSWAIKTSNLVSGYAAKLREFQIIYRGQNVENLSISKVIFWNRGGETINRIDIADTDPLRICAVGDAVLLHVKVLQANNTASAFSVSLSDDRQAAYIDFEYLDRAQGAVVQVVHSGTSSKDLQLLGSIKGSGSPQKRDIAVLRYLPFPPPFDSRLKPAQNRLVVGLMAIILSIIFVITIVAIYISIALGAVEPLEAWKWLLIILVGGGFSLSYFIVGVTFIWRAKTPRGLHMFEEEM